jgi:TetR/AcrR family transcriptional regulator, cholesterol catabolism regulator
VAAKKGTSEIGRRRMERRLSSGRRSDTRWQEILQGAAKVFHRVGYAQATLEDVAAEVGVNRASLYYYVGTKEELLIALLYRPIHQMTANAKSIAALGLAPDETLRRVLLQWTADMSATPELMLFLSLNLHQHLSGREADDIAKNADEYGKLLTAIVARGVKARVFRSDVEPRVAMLAILGMFNWIHRWYAPEGRLSLPEIGEEFAKLALASLRPR